MTSCSGEPARIRPDLDRRPLCVQARWPGGPVDLVQVTTAAPLASLGDPSNVELIILACNPFSFVSEIQSPAMFAIQRDRRLGRHAIFDISLIIFSSAFDKVRALGLRSLGALAIIGLMFDLARWSPPRLGLHV